MRYKAFAVALDCAGIQLEGHQAHRIIYFGVNALILILASIVSAVFFEWLYQTLLKKPVTISDLWILWNAHEGYRILQS